MFLKKSIPTFLVLLIAVVTGLAVGKVYVSTLPVPELVAASEDQIREDPEKVLELVNKSKTALPTAFTAVQLYEIAEYNLNNAQEFYKCMTGTVHAPMGIKQPMKGERLKKDGKFIYTKLSPSTSSLAPQICSRFIFDLDDLNKITVYPTGTIVSTSPEIIGSFDKNNAQMYSLEDYKNTFNTIPTTALPYIISSVTCGAGTTTPVTKNKDGDFTFKISLKGSALTIAALYYSYEIKYSSNFKDPPKWVSLEMEVTVDSNYNFKKIAYSEVYKMNQPGIGLMQVRDEFVDVFEFENVPSIDEVLGEVV